MAKRKYSSEEIIHKLREADVLHGQGKTITEACKQLAITDQTYFRWRKRYGGLKVDQAKRRREAVALVRSRHRFSERRICRALGIARSTLRYVPEPRPDEAPLRSAVIGLASQYGRYGYRLVTGLLQQSGWQLSRSRVWLADHDPDVDRRVHPGVPGHPRGPAHPRH